MLKQKIGTVEVLMQRTYPLDGDSPEPRIHASVKPGVYPIFQIGTARFWIMEGDILHSNRRLGDGLIVMGGGDAPSGVKCSFPSQTYGEDEFRSLLEHPIALEGHHYQRLRFTIFTMPEVVS